MTMLGETTLNLYKKSISLSPHDGSVAVNRASNPCPREADGPRFPCFVVRKEKRMRDRNFSICHSIAARDRRILPSLQQSSGEISAFPVGRGIFQGTKE